MANRVLRDWTASERVDKLSIAAEVFFTRLIMKVDDYGALYANTKLIKASLYPLRDSVKIDNIIKWLKECEDVGIIKTYSVKGKEYLQIIDFGQRLDRARAKYPTLDEQDLIGYVYLMESGNLHKIGFSLNPWARVKEIKSPIDKTVVLTMTFKGTKNDEKAIHELLREFNYDGEWFSLESCFTIFEKAFHEKKSAAEIIVDIRSNRSPAELETETQFETETETKAADAVTVWPSFDDFWQLYDKNNDKPKCLKKWEKIKQGAREKIMEHLALYTRATPDRQYRKNPLTYLTHESWNDEIIIPNPNGKQLTSKNGKSSAGDLAAALQERINQDARERQFQSSD